MATASAAVACSLGYHDGERITFRAMLDAIRRIAASVEVPLTADIERGYATDLDRLAANTRQVIAAGAVGINIEDSTVEGGPLLPIERQGERIRAARRAAEDAGVPIVINARTDVFISKRKAAQADNVAETIERGEAYLEAGADCIYPILAGERDVLAALVEALDAPINVYAPATKVPMRELEAIGVSRLSLGPALMRTALKTMMRVAREVQNYGSFEVFTRDALSAEDVERFLSPDRMPED